MQVQSAQFLDPDLVNNSLKNNPFIQDIHVYRSVASTNTLAKRLADAGAPSGTLVLAEKQTAGKGRLGKGWSSPEGLGLWFSLVFRPESVNFEYSLLPLILSEEIALSLHDFLGMPFAVKWPNDILFEGKKLCGILCESSHSGRKLEYVVAGMGLNVNHSVSDFPEELREIATSLLLISGISQDRLKLLLKILENFKRRFCGYIGNVNDLTEWRRLCHELGKRIRVNTEDGPIFGVFQDISASGEMILREDDGIIHTLRSGELTIMRE